MNKFKNIKKLISSMAIALSTVSAATTLTFAPMSAVMAKESKNITVLRLSPPGGGTAIWTDGITQTLQSAGYNATIKPFKTCQEGAEWYSKNPNEPIVALVFSDFIIQNLADSTHPAGCKFPVTEKSLVGIVGKWYHFICSKPEYGLEYLLSDQPKFIGSWNGTIQMKVIQDQMTDIGVKNFKVVGYASGKTQIQSLMSNDTQYTVLSSEAMVKGLNLTCFATSAPIDIAKGINRVSYSELNPNVRHAGSGLWPLIVGYNVDTTAIREILFDESKQSDVLKAMVAPLLPVTESIEQQVKELEERAKNL